MSPGKGKKMGGAHVAVMEVSFKYGRYSCQGEEAKSEVGRNSKLIG